MSVPGNLKLFTDGLPTIVYNGMKNETCGAVEFIKMGTDDPTAWLEDLYHRGVTSVMVEGGTHVLQQMIDAQAWDEARIEVSPRRVGQGVAAPVIEGRMAARYLVDGNRITYLTRPV